MVPSRRVLAIFAWSGVATVVVALLGWLIAGVLPFPLGPSSTPAQVVDFYTVDNVRVKIGLVIATVGIALVIPLFGLISFHLMRAEGRYPIAAFTLLVAGGLTGVLLIFPLLIMAVIAFGAPHRYDTQTVYMLNDLAWLAFLTPIAPFIIQNVVLGTAILRDPAETFPRWVGYLNFFIAVSFVPDVLAYFFFSGVLGWNGVIVFWLALTTYALFLFVMGYSTDRANKAMLATVPASP